MTSGRERRRHLRHRAERYTNVQVARAACTECGIAHGVSARGAGPAGLRCRAHTYSRHARVRTKGFFVRARFRGSAEFSLGVFPKTRSFPENSEFQLGVKSEL